MAARKPPPIEHPALSQSLARLARALDRRSGLPDDAPGYLDLVELLASISTDLDDVQRLLVHYARRYDGATWDDIAARLGVTRQTAYYRYGAPSANDVEAEG